MIPIEYYSITYHLALTYVVLLLLYSLVNNKQVLHSRAFEHWGVLVMFMCILFIGLRDPMASSKYLGDTSAYTRMYLNSSLPVWGESRDYGFEYFMYICSIFMPVQLFYLLCASLYVFLPYIAFKKWFKSGVWIALLVYVTAMSFWSFGINGLRNGLGVAVFIYALSCERRALQWLLFFVAVGLHKSMLLPVCAWFIAGYCTNIKFWLRVWLIVIPIAYFYGDGLEIAIGAWMESLGWSDVRLNYFSEKSVEITQMSRAFRPDFILYSSVPIILGCYYIFKRQFQDVFYCRLLNLYLIANAVWILLIYAPYTNRTAYLSWFIMPVILVYPLLKGQVVKKQALWLVMTVLGNLIFTLIMFFK